MSDFPSKAFTAFQGTRRIASGTLTDVALAAKTSLVQNPAAAVLVFDDAAGTVIDLDLRGSPAEIVARLSHQVQQTALGLSAEARPAEEGPTPRGRGRPRLGVVAREVTLLPRHWEWLAAQPGGASQALRRLVDHARRADHGRSRTRTAQEAAYRFMAAMAGDLPGFEEAVRALFAADRERFSQQTVTWPADIRAHAEKLAWGDRAAAD